MADGIKVVVLENDFAALCRLGLPVSLSLQLQQSGLKLADALWTARSSGSGFSVSLFWPSDIRTSKRGRKGKAVKTVRKDNKKARKNTKVLATTSVTSAATATAANQPETPINAQQPILCGNSAEISHPAEVSVSLTTTTVTPSMAIFRTSKLHHLLTYRTVMKSPMRRKTTSMVFPTLMRMV